MEYLYLQKADNDFYSEYIDHFGEKAVENCYKYFSKEI